MKSKIYSKWEKDCHKMVEECHKAGYADWQGDINFDRMASDKVWATKDGKLLKYHEIPVLHLESILDIFKQGRFKDRSSQLRGLKEEYYSRLSLAGKVLYGHK